MMDGGSGHAFDVELTLCDPKECLVLALGTVATPSYKLTEPVLNLNILRMTPALCSKYNQIACNENAKITVPFKTYRCHSSSLTTATKQKLYIHEMASNIKRVWSVLTKATFDVNADQNLGFYGGVKDTSIQIEEYQFQVGNQFMFSESIQEVSNNNNHITLNHVKGGSFSHG